MMKTRLVGSRSSHAVAEVSLRWQMMVVYHPDHVTAILVNIDHARVLLPNKIMMVYHPDHATMIMRKE